MLQLSGLLAESIGIFLWRGMGPGLANQIVCRQTHPIRLSLTSKVTSEPRGSLQIEYNPPATQCL